MPACRLTEAADRDIADILGETLRRFGPVQFERYATFIERAAELVAERPDRPGSRPRTDLGEGVRAYHIEHATSRQGAAAHMLYYVVDDEGVLILRILHERMEPAHHLPEF